MKKFLVEILDEGRCIKQLVVFAETREDAIEKARGIFSFTYGINPDHYIFAAAALPDDWEFK